MEDRSLFYETNNGKFKRFGRFNECPALDGEYVIEFKLDKDIRKNLQLARSKKWRTRKKHAKKLLEILIAVYGLDAVLEQYQESLKRGKKNDNN